MDAGELKLKINEIKVVYGFNTVVVIGVCLAFPRVLNSNMEGLLSCEMGESKSIFLEYSEEDLVRKIEYFRKLNVEKEQVGLFLLSKPEIFGFDLDDRVILVKELLYDLGLSKKELMSLEQKYPHVFGRNQMANLPHIMRSMDVGECFFERMKKGDHSLLDTYKIHSENGDMDKYYSKNLLKLKAKRSHMHVIHKYAVKALALSNSSSTKLHQRFDFLLSCGIEYSKLCAMVSKKIEYLCKDMGLSLQYLDDFPGYLCHDLEKRIKRRYELHKWLVEKEFSPFQGALRTLSGNISNRDSSLSLLLCTDYSLPLHQTLVSSIFCKFSENI
ncbi:hypothetical protein ACJIZ3_007814 [Penstemon smallii]|uniref:Uncharacterized protein n=1 Tax=Penstemon smallii TaxID=265156 RepID=A0ABD3T901_9LAMI